MAKIAFPIVGGWHVKNLLVEGLTIEGNRAKRDALDGCRGGGIYLFESEAVTIRNCLVRQYNGDGISFQVSHHVIVENCRCENNSGLGLHPGSGSQYPVVRHNHTCGNGADGLFVCWRVKHGLFEDNEIRDNHGSGISIGHKDSDNLFRGNTISGNGAAGVLFRDEDVAMGAHRNIFEDNRILDNWTSGNAEQLKAAIVIRGHHHDLVFRHNVLGNSIPLTGTAVGLLTSRHADRLKVENNQMLNVSAEIETEKK